VSAKRGGAGSVVNAASQINLNSVRLILIVQKQKSKRERERERKAKGLNKTRVQLQGRGVDERAYRGELTDTGSDEMHHQRSSRARLMKSCRLTESRVAV
jgi:hypothetical protein